MSKESLGKAWPLFLVIAAIFAYAAVEASLNHWWYYLSPKWLFSVDIVDTWHTNTPVQMYILMFLFVVFFELGIILGWPHLK